MRLALLIVGQAQPAVQFDERSSWVPLERKNNASLDASYFTEPVHERSRLAIDADQLGLPLDEH